MTKNNAYQVTKEVNTRENQQEKKKKQKLTYKYKYIYEYNIDLKKQKERERGKDKASPLLPINIIANIRGVDTKVLINSGSALDIIDKTQVKENNIPQNVKEHLFNILGYRRDREAKKIVVEIKLLKIIIGDHVKEIRFNLANIGSAYQAYLRYQWLQLYNLIINQEK